MVVPVTSVGTNATSNSADNAKDNFGATSYLDRLKLSAKATKIKKIDTECNEVPSGDSGSACIKNEAKHVTSNSSSTSTGPSDTSSGFCRPGKFSSQLPGGASLVPRTRAPDFDDDDFFGALDKAEEIEKKKIEAEWSRVRYWYEPGYQKGDEKSPDDVEDEEEDEVIEDPDGRCPDDEYVEIVPASGDSLGMAQGGQCIQWGGISGKLALCDGPVNSADDESAEVPDLEEVLDELLLPGTEANEDANDNNGKASGSVDDIDNEPEVTTIVQTQIPPERSKTKWSFNMVASDGMSSAAIETKTLRERYAIVDDGKENSQVRSDKPQELALLAIQNDLLRKERKDEFLSKLRKQEMKARTPHAKKGACERLPGTKKPIGASQAWQERKAATEGSTPAAPTTPFRGRAMLPGMFADDPPQEQRTAQHTFGEFASHTMRIPKPMAKMPTKKPEGGSRPFSFQTQKRERPQI